MKTSKTLSLSWQNKLISTALASVSLILGSPQLAMATLPVITSSNLVVQAGSATASTSTTNSVGTPEALTITATSANTVLTWTNFSDNTANGGLLTTNDNIYYNLPTGGAILNNITGGFTTILGGSIKSNGNVFFLNPAGVIVGANSNINVNGLYISTIPDASANAYFYANGSLGVFNGLAQAATTNSGIIYIQSGATITTSIGNGQVSLASAYAGPAVTITGNLSGGVTTNGVLNTTTDTYSAGFALNNGSASATVQGISIDSINTNGNLTIISQGNGAPVNIGATVLQSGYPAGGGLLTGGVEQITTNGGAVQLGSINNGGSLTITTTNSATASTATITGTGLINVAGTATLTTNNANINISGAGVNLVTTAAANISAGSAGNVTINGDLASGSLYGNAVTYTDVNTASASRTLSSVTSYGTFQATSVGTLTVSQVNAGGGINVTSTGGGVTVGSLTGPVSTINGASGVTISGATSAAFNNANVNVGGNTTGTITVTTANSTKTAPVSITSVTTNGATGSAGAITASTTLGNITLASVSTVGTATSGITLNAGNFGGGNGGGTITLTNVTINKGNIIAATANSSFANGSITLTSVNSNALGLSNPDSYTTTNGNISVSSYNTASAPLNINQGTQTGSLSYSVSSGGSSVFGGPVTVSTGNGSITLTGFSVLGSNPTQVTANILTLSQGTTTQNNSITVAANSDLVVAAITNNTGANSNNLATQTISISSTGNLTVQGTVVAPNVTLLAATGGTYGALTLSNPVQSQNNGGNYGTVKLQSYGDLSTTLNVNPAYLPAKSLTLTSVSGNINVNNSGGLTLGSAVGGSATLTATSGNVNFSTAGTVTTNGLTVVAGNSITENNGGIIDNSNGGVALTSSASFNAGNYISLPGYNTLPNVTVIGAPNNAYVSVGAQNIGSPSLNPSATLNIAGGTNVTGNLSITSAGPISIGVNPTDAITVVGFTTLNTANTSSSAATISTASNAPSLVQGISALTDYASVSIGTATGTPNIGQISVSALGNSSTKPVTSINSASAVNLGSISAYTLNVNAPSVNNTSGVVSTTANANITTSSTGSVVLGNNTAPAAVSVLNLVSAGSLTLNSSSAVTINGNANNLSTLSIVDSGGNAGYYSTGTVGTVTASTAAGTLTYIAGPTSSGSLSTLTGSITATSTGLGNVTFNLGAPATSKTSSITNLGSFTLNNVISSGCAALNVSANSTVASPSTLTLGSGIVLNGTGAVSFAAGPNSAATANSGLVTDGASAVTINSNATTTFYGKSISISNTGSTYGPIALTSNGAGNVNFTANGSVVLGGTGVTLGTAASGTDSITSLTGNISQLSATTGNVNISNSASSITFTASSTGNNGVVLNTAVNNIYNGNVVSIIASGNSALQTNNNITLGTVTVMPAVGATPNANDLQLSVVTTSGNIAQSGTTSVKTWGNAFFQSTGTAGITLANAGNNFGAITAYATSTGNVNIVEAATSTYNAVTALGFTAASTYGDILTSSTSNSTIIVSGNSNLTANNVSLTNTGDQLNGTGGTVYVKAAQNATLIDTALFTTIANGSSIGGNFTITDPTPFATIQDQAGTSGITVTGIASLLATASGSGQINFAGTNNKFGGLITKSAGMNNVTVNGNLVLVPGSANTNGYFTAINGNISTSGSGAVGTYGYLTLVTTLGSVTISNDLKVTSALTINAPLGTVNLSGMSVSVDLTNGNAVVTPTISAATYIAPNP